MGSWNLQLGFHQMERSRRIIGSLLQKEGESDGVRQHHEALVKGNGRHTRNEGGDLESIISTRRPGIKDPSGRDRIIMMNES